jgi:hypothetical protein
MSDQNLNAETDDDDYLYSFIDGYDPPAPHMDNVQILHAPGECEHCDEHPYEQGLRAYWDINWTGHNDPSKSPCPSARFGSARDWVASES